MTNPSLAAWRSFSAAPHRLFFWGGSLYAVVSVALWTLQQASLFTGALPPIVWNLAAPQAHAFMMIYGLFGLYFMGFLLTVFPRWLDGEAVPPRTYVTAWALMLAGALGFWLGLFLDARLALAAVLALLAGHLLGLGACLKVLRRAVAAMRPDLAQPAHATAALALGALGLAAYALFIAGGEPWAYRLARGMGLYGYVLAMVFTVAWRMVPFFTGTVSPGYEVRRGAYALPLFFAACVLRAALVALDAGRWLWLADLALLAVLARELVRWRCWRVRRPPLLVVLYLALGWVALGLALSAVEGLLVWLGLVAAPPFRNAALHAMAVGGFGTLLLGFPTRVTLGHSGRGLATGRFVAGLFYGFQLVPLARIVPEIAGFWLPAMAIQGYWAGLGWVAAFGVWFARFAPVLMRPRADGRLG